MQFHMMELNKPCSSNSFSSTTPTDIIVRTLPCVEVFSMKGKLRITRRFQTVSIFVC